MDILRWLFDAQIHVGTNPSSCAKSSATRSAWHQRWAACDAKYGHGPSESLGNLLLLTVFWAPSSVARTP